MSNFYMILTAIGIAKMTNAQLTSETIELTTIAVGDSNGAYYTPSETQTALVNEKWRGNINAISVDDDNPNWIVAEGFIPSAVGGFNVRELGLIDSEGDLFAIGKVPETYKPALEEGSTKDLYLKAILEVSNASSVTLKIDPAVIMASRKYVDDKVQIVSTNLTSIQRQLTEHLDKSGQLVTVKPSVNQSFVSGNYLDVVFGNLSTLKNADYIELVGGQIKFTKSGIYKIYGIVASVESASSNGIRYAFVDGVTPSSSPATIGAGVFTSVIINTVRAKNVNDTLSVAFYHNNSTAIEVKASETTIYIERIGDLE